MSPRFAIRSPLPAAGLLLLAAAGLFLVPQGPWRTPPLLLGWTVAMVLCPRAGLGALLAVGAAPFLLSAAWVDGSLPGSALLFTLADLAPQHRLLGLLGDPWTSPPLYGDSPLHYAAAPAGNAAAWIALACAALPFLRRRPSPP